MHKWKIHFLIITVATLSNCTSQKKISYNIPQGYPASKKAALIAELDRGKALYKEYCTGCHGIFKNGKDGIPDFSKQQINIYAQKFLYRDPKNHAFVIDIGGDQLNQILEFLRWRDTKGLKADSSGRRI